MKYKLWHALGNTGFEGQLLKVCLLMHWVSYKWHDSGYWAEQGCANTVTENIIQSAIHKLAHNPQIGLCITISLW